MKRRASVLALVVPAVLGTLVLALAALQYRWLGQVSDAERQELRTSIDRRAREFADEVDREIAGLQNALRTAAHTSGSNQAAGLSRQLDLWKATSDTPSATGTSTPRAGGLVRAVYVAKSQRGDLTLHRLDGARQTLEPSTWPDELKPVRERVMPAGSISGAWSSRGGGLETGEFNRKVTYRGGSFVGSVPALIVWLPPILQDAPPLRPSSSQPIVREALEMIMGVDGTLVGDALIIELDRQFVVGTWLPALVQRHFGSGQFRWEIVDAEGHRLVDGGLGAGQVGLAERADAVTALFSGRTPVPGQAPAEATMMWTRAAPVRGTPVSGNQIAVIERRNVDVIRLASAGPGDEWRLRVQHAAGSLDLAVARARRRNLFLSFGILSVLVAAVGLVLANARRSERLAARQMDFVATVSHELRTPLAVIRSAAENLSAGVVHGPDQARRYGDLIEAEGRRLSSMVEQVLEHAGVNATTRARLLADVNVNDVVRESASACAGVAAQAGCELALTLAATLPAVHADEAALKRSLDNLIVNAVKHGGSGHWVGITTRATVGDDGPRVEVEVADRGAGIDAKDLPHIFEPFYRGRTAVSRQVQGSGLGLSLVKQAMEAMGGDVRVEPRADGGAAFIMRLRAGATEENAAPAHGVPA